MSTLRQTIVWLDEGEWNNITDLKERVTDFLVNFDFISKEEESQDSGFSMGIRRFQEFYAIDETGKADLVTRSLLKEARCGNFRYKRGLSAKNKDVEDLYEWDGLCSWPFGDGDRKLTYGFDSNVNLEQHKEFCDQVRSALAIWASHCHIQLNETTSLAGVDIAIDRRSAADPDGFSMLGNEAIAHADYPGKCGQFGLPKPIHFDVQEHKWGAGHFNLWSVALHEMGHILGFKDSNDPKSVMYHYFWKNEPDRDFTPTDLKLKDMLYP